MPVRGALVLPSPDTNTPDVPIPAHVFLTPDDFDIPHRRCFTPRELAACLYADARQIIGLIEEGKLRALPIGHGRYKIPYVEIAEFFKRQQTMPGAMN